LKAEIIIKHLLGKTSEEEEAMLTAWRKESEENEQTFQRLSDPHYLESEWRKRKAVNAEKAAEQMQQRIGRERPIWLRPAFYRSMAAAVVIALCCGVTVGYLLHENPEEKQVSQALPERPVLQLMHGQTKATLTLSDGKSVELTGELTAQEMAQLTTSHSAPTTNDKEQHGEVEHISLSVPRGGEFKIELEDGTEVWLNAQSKLVYPEAFSETERRVQVEGEAYFKVARNEDKPFYVETDNQVVRVVGTEFNVHAYSEDQTVQTTLVSGKIAMQQKGSEDREMVLTPGHQAVYDKSQRSVKVKRVDTEVVTSWKEGMFVFEDQRLSDIMQTLSRWYDFTYEFKDRKSPETVFMGRIPRYSDFKDVMEIIEASGGLKLEQHGRKITISSK